MIKRKPDLKAVIILLCIFALFTGCSSYRIKDQKDPSLSLLIIKTNIPDGFTIERSFIKNKNENAYKSSFRSSQYDNRYSKYLVFENIPEGEYRIGYLYAETTKTYSSYTVGKMIYTTSNWKTLDLSFNYDTEENSKIADNWMKVKPSSIVYGGDVAWFQLNTKNEIMDKVANYYKKSKKDIEKSILYNLELVSPKSREQYFILRFDHPALVGEKESMKSELSVLQGFRKVKKSENIIWDKMIDERIQELKSKISSMPDKKK